MLSQPRHGSMPSQRAESESNISTYIVLPVGQSHDMQNGPSEYISVLKSTTWIFLLTG
jgi:hypothetical protein